MRNSRTLVQWGNVLAAARRKLGLSRAHVADSAGVSRQTVWRVERGLTPQVPMTTVERLAKAVGYKLRMVR